MSHSLYLERIVSSETQSVLYWNVEMKAHYLMETFIKVVVGAIVLRPNPFSNT